MSFALKDIYQSVTNQIITALEAGTSPWVCPWQAGSGDLAPANLSSGRPYRGINVLLLNLRARSSGYTANRWITFQQARGLGACVRKGEEGTPVVFFKMLERDGAMPAAANDQPGRKVIPLLRTFTVFNAAQIDGLPEALLPKLSAPNYWDSCGVADLILQASQADLRHGGSRAFYSPSQDFIQMPERASFDSADAY